ncbi:MAG: fasciclin domain-containing protein [Bacteroidales bacterium]|nr:fasciclin domain-containing protein [Bacteroidales bacterium]
MTLNRLLAPLAIVIICFAGCNPELRDEDKYARPDWLAGKIYSQILELPDLSTFALCLERTGYDTIINTSGSYTVFAPTNEAFALYLQSQPSYDAVEDIPLPELNKIVKYHIVQNPWTKIQLRTLDVYGWIDSLDRTNNKPRGFKRQTLYLENNRKVGVLQNPDRSIKVVDTLESDLHRIIATDSRKYVPIFFKEYFNIYDLTTDDYTFYFDRPIENPGDIFFAGGKILGDEIFAENGFIYLIDRVVEPMPNAFQWLESDPGGRSYASFLNMVNFFPEFEYNEDKTFDQPGADQGLEVDSLFDINYPQLAFNILNEQTRPPTGTFGLPGNVTIRYHHGLIAPTDEAFNEFWNEYFVGPTKWNTLSATPKNIIRILVNTHMSPNPIYKTDLETGFYNGEMDLIRVDPSDILDKQYGSNSTFIGVSKTIVPRVFNSVAGPVYLLRGYSKTMYAIEEAGLLSALKRENTNFLLYVESNANTAQDSSLLYTSGNFSLFQISEGSVREYRLDKNDLRILLMNHIGVGLPTGLCQKEFIRNLAGNFIIINHETGEVSGTATTTVGYQGLETRPNYPVPITTGADNGSTYEIENWFSFSALDIYQKIRSDFPGFHSLLLKAGLANEFTLRFPFLSENEEYTVLIPSDSALTAFRADTLDTKKLQDLLRLHFIQGALIFTDGSQPAGYYKTTRRDERSTPFTTIYSNIYIQPGYGSISIQDKEGGIYTTVDETDVSNIITGRDIGETNDIFKNYISTGVLHKINRVLDFDELNTN